MTSKAEFLQKLPIFSGLNKTELTQLAQICYSYTFDRGAVVAYQRDVADSLYIVRSGRLVADRLDAVGRIERSTAYLPGTCFDDSWLFAADVHPATVRGVGNGELLILKGSDFLHFLDKNPAALAKLQPGFDDEENVPTGLSEKGWQEAQKMRMKANRQSSAVSLLPDELVEFYARRSHWFLLYRLFVPGLGLLFLPVMLYVALTVAGGAWASIAWITAVILALVFLAWMAFRFLDWSNDYFVITNKRLIHREFSLRTFHVNDIKIPIEQVQSVETTKPSLLATLFKIGTARITTASQAGVLVFDNLDNPDAVKDALGRLSQRVRSLDAGRTQAAMRQSLEGYFAAPPPMQKTADDPDGKKNTPAARSDLSFWESLRKGYQWRVEEDGVITYRKHIFILFEQIAWPVGAGLILLILAYVLVAFFQFTLAEIVLVFSVLFLADLGWLVWNMEDWRNDTYQVTSRSVIDIDRLPFGFRESRKEAALSNIQNVNADRPGLLPTLFNYGRVVVETAGAKSDIIFESVPNPSQIQSDIFRQLEQLRVRQRVQEGEQRRKEYAVLLDVYQQAHEQRRIPTRTPTYPLPEEEIEIPIRDVMTG